MSAIIFRLFFLAYLVVVSACSSDNGDRSDLGLPSNDLQASSDDQRIIQGRVYNAVDMQPVVGATVFTVPATQSVRTALDGTYQLVVHVDAARGEHTLRTAKLGYSVFESSGVASMGSNNVVDIPLTPDGQNLVASPDSIDIPAERNIATFFVSGAFESSSFDVSSDVPWLEISPSSGIITNSSAERITLAADRSALGSRGAVATVTVRADNGAVATVLVDIDANPGETADLSVGSADVLLDTAPVMRNDQADCRRSDILRVGNTDTTLPLVVFPQTNVLPGGEGDLSVNQLAFLAYADSFQINTRGLLTVRHSSGSSEYTLGTLFEVDMNNVVEILAENTFPLQTNRRSSVSVTLDPGIYCYLLRPPEGVFGSFAQLGLNIDFIPE